MLYSCNCKKNKLVVWEKFQKEIIAGNLNYLIQNSADTIKCMECNKGKSIIPKDDFFKNHFNQMKIAKNSDYVYFTEKINDNNFNKRHRISYVVNSKETIVYTLLEGDGEIKFIGVFSVP